jgi:hypothetical protein
MYYDSPSLPVHDYFIGLDLGQAQDPTALAVIERATWPGSYKPPQYSCRHLQCWQLGTPYPQIVQDVHSMTWALGPGGLLLLPGATLVVDGTGVGRAVVDMFRGLPALRDRTRSVIITFGHATTYDRMSGAWHVAKKELVGVLQTLMQTRRLKVARSLADAEILIKEFLNFKVKITSAGNEIFENWRERDHDDLVLALAVALWYAEKHPPTFHDDDYGVDIFGPRKGSWG